MNPNQTSQNLKRKFSLIAQPNSIPYSDSNGDFDASWKEKFSSGQKQITLLSVTIAPSGTFTKGSQYYNSTDKLIYTAINDDTWTGATTSTPEFGIIYLYDNSGTNEYYIWDGDNLVETDLEKYQLKSSMTDSYTSSSTVTYPSSKALKDGLTTKQDTNLIFTNVSADNWVADTTYSNFGYKCELTCSGVDSTMTALIIFDPDDNVNNDYANISLIGTNTITIYSKVNTTITIPKIIVLK